MGFPDSSLGTEFACNAGDTTVFLGFPGGSADKETICNAGGLDSIPRLGRSPGEGNGYPFQYSGLENFMDCNGVTKNRTRLGNFHVLSF